LNLVRIATSAKITKSGKAPLSRSTMGNAIAFRLQRGPVSRPWRTRQVRRLRPGDVGRVRPAGNSARCRLARDRINDPGEAKGITRAGGTKLKSG
jgi:hypothetical protein